MKKKEIKKKTAVVMAHGGYGDFLFQLDLAKRLEDVNIPTIFLIRKNFKLLSDIVSKSNVRNSHLLRADGAHYLLAVVRVSVLALFREVFVINSFHFTRLRLPTKVFYTFAKLCTARVIVSQRVEDESFSYEQVPYEKDEMIWKRNIRIARHVSGEELLEKFPILSFNSGNSFSNISYIHIHPVASVLEKSYPARKLKQLLQMISKNTRVLVTMTPKEESWYVTDELRSLIDSSDHITLVSKHFPTDEISGYIRNARVFLTVNTGLLWLAIMLGQRVVVCDTFTDIEWNPSFYPNVTRLCHEYDESGSSLHLQKKNHDDGTYFESMYRIEPEVIREAIGTYV